MAQDANGNVVKGYRYFDSSNAKLERELLELEFRDRGLVVSEIEESVPCTTMPSDGQRKELCDLMYKAFVTIRFLAWEKNHEAIAGLADAFHNLPHEMYDESSWDWSRVEFYLHEYEKSFSEVRAFRFSERLLLIKSGAEQSGAGQDGFAGRVTRAGESGDYP